MHKLATLKFTKSILKAVIPAALSFCLVGCASFVHGETRKISVQSTPSQATVAVFAANQQQIAQAQTPAVLKLKAGAGYFHGASYRLVIAKPGFQPTEVFIKPTLNPWYFANFLFGGMVGLLVIDPLSGSMWRLWPKDVKVTLSRGAAAVVYPSEGSQEGAQIVAPAKGKGFP
jgi:hypothetical protein